MLNGRAPFEGGWEARSRGGVRPAQDGRGRPTFWRSTTSSRVQGEEEILRRQFGRVRGDIGRLVGVLKTLGASALVSIQEELSRLEQEERRLDEQFQEVSKRKDPLDRISSQARKFIETWKNVGQLLDQAGAEEQRLILQHYIEVIELRATDSKGKTGTYALRLFPEAHHPPG